MSTEKQPESGYHGLVKGEDPKLWQNKPSEITEDIVYIDGHPVMESWEKPYQDAIVKVACSKGGRILEVGFGLALSASAIQTHDIEEHVIIEANKQVFEKLVVWAEKQPHKVIPKFGLWQDVVSTLPDSEFDGIYYDTYPNNEESQHIHQFDFIKHAPRILKPGGVLTYCNLTSLGVLRPRYTNKDDKAAWEELFAETQLPHLLKCGFKMEDIKPIQVFGPLKPPSSCDYYQHETLLIPHVEKAHLVIP